MSRRAIPAPLLSQINEVANYIADNLDQLVRTNDWRRPWRNVPRCYHPKDRHEFSFLNCLGFWHTMVKRDFDRPIWATQRDWRVCGREVRSEELNRFTYGSVPNRGGSVPVQRTGDPEDEARDHTSGYGLAKYFNVQQTLGREIYDLHRPTVRDDKFVDLVRRTTGVQFIEGGERACYVPDDDVLRMPLPDTFMDLDGVSASEHYYGTLLHELAHATGHAKRLNRFKSPTPPPRNSKEYWFEELVAEFAASQLSVDLTVSPFVREDHFEYLTHYANLLRTDVYALPHAAAQADKARIYLVAVAGNAVLRQLPLRDAYTREEILTALRDRLPNPQRMLEVFVRQQTLVRELRPRSGRPRRGETIRYFRGPNWKSDMEGVRDGNHIRLLHTILGF